jgi:hypothetical protein
MRMPRALGIPGFGPYCLGQGVSIIGTGMQCVLVPWFVYVQTQSPLALALVGVTTALSLCLLPYGGVIADRHGRWGILIISQVVALAQALALGLIALTGTFTLWFVLALNFLAGAITAFEFPARQAFKSELATEDQLPGVLGFYNSVDGTAFAIGQAIGGLMIVYLSWSAASLCFLINAASYLAALGALLAVRRYSVPTRRVTAADAPALSMMAGLRLMGSNRLVLTLVLQTAIVVLFCRRFEAPLPAFAGAGLGDVDAFGWLKVAILVGTIIGGWCMASISDKEQQLRWSYFTLLALPTTLLAAFATSYLLAASFLLAVAAGVMLVQDSCSLASIQTNVNASMRGRVVSWRGTVNWGLDLAVVLPFGWAATAMGVRPVLMIGAVMGGVAALALLCCRPKN